LQYSIKGDLLGFSVEPRASVFGAYPTWRAVKRRAESGAAERGARQRGSVNMESQRTFDQAIGVVLMYHRKSSISGKVLVVGNLVYGSEDAWKQQ